MYAVVLEQTFWISGASSGWNVGVHFVDVVLRTLAKDVLQFIQAPFPYKVTYLFCITGYPVV